MRHPTMATSKMVPKATIFDVGIGIAIEIYGHEKQMPIPIPTPNDCFS